MSLTRVQALQLLGLKVGASPAQITESYHKQHPAAERAAQEGKPERLRRLDEAYRLLMAQTDPELRDAGFAAPDGRAPAASPDRGTQVQAAHDRFVARTSGGGGLWLVILVVVIGALGAWYMGLIPGVPKMFD